MAGIRLHFKDAVHFVTNRCEQELLLMLPGNTVNEIILQWFVKAICLFGEGLEIYAFIFLGNHFHILLKDTRGNLAKFMCYFQANVAKALNAELGRHGKFWAREYDDVIVDGEAEFLDRYAYTVCNSIKAGLTDRASQWPGLSSLHNARTEESYKIEVINRTKLHNATRRGQKVDLSKFKEKFKFSLSVPPMLEGLSQEKRIKYIDDLVKAYEMKFRELRNNKPPLGVKKILDQKPSDHPSRPSFRPRIKVFSFDRDRRRELLRAYREFVAGYRSTWEGFIKASTQGRRPVVEWPKWSYPPSSWSPMGFPVAA